MNDGANKYFDAFEYPSRRSPFRDAVPSLGRRYAHDTQRGLLTQGLVLTHTHRRFPVTDLELGITAGFVNFNQSLPDVHIFKYNADGKIELIQAVFGGRQQGPIWPD